MTFEAGWTSHIPGYKGYVPQRFHSVGDTYGRLTGAPPGSADLMAPGRRQLTMPAAGAAGAARRRQDNWDVARTRADTTSAHPVIMRDSMKSGYMGTVPRLEHHFAESYGYCTDGAITDFERRQKALPPLPDPAPARVYFRRRPEQLAEAVHPVHPTGGNHNRNPRDGVYCTRSILRQVRPEDEGFKERYTGFVPLKRPEIGQTYEQASRKAYSSFLTNTQRLQHQQQQQQQQQQTQADSTFDRLQEFVAPQLAAIRNHGQSLYKHEVAQLPLYTGHVPGKDFDYGRTYGRLTSQAASQFAGITA